MARRLDSFDFGKRTGKPKYPWHKWANGEPWEIVQGTDYTCTSGSFVVYLYHKAREMGCTVQTSRERGTGRKRDRVRFQFVYPTKDERQGEPVRRRLKRKQR